MLYDWTATSRTLKTANVEIAVLPIGAIEQHSIHLPLGTDWLAAEAVGRRVAGILGQAHERTPEELLPLITLLRRQADEWAAGRIIDLMRHPSIEVRTAAVRSLPHPLPDRLSPRLLRFLESGDELMRKALVDLLARRSVRNALEVLEPVILGKKFGKASAGVKRSLTVGLAMAVGDRALPVLDKEIRGHWFPTGSARARSDLEACAAALSAIGSVQARQRLL